MVGVVARALGRDVVSIPAVLAADISQKHLLRHLEDRQPDRDTPHLDDGLATGRPARTVIIVAALLLRSSRSSIEAHRSGSFGGAIATGGPWTRMHRKVVGEVECLVHAGF